MQKTIILILIGLFATTNNFADAKQTGNLVKDEQNAIYWQDTLASQVSSEDWDDAELYCSKLVLDGMEKWRLPTFRELLSIVDYKLVHPAINPLFSYTNEGTYWTSTDFSPTPARAWTIDFRTGETYYNYKTTNHAVRCVRDIQVQPAKENK